MKENTDWYHLEGEPSVETMGRITAANVHPARNVAFWVLGIVHAGRRTIQIGERRYTFTPGDYFLLPPHIEHGGIETDAHEVFFVHFHMAGKRLAPPSRLRKDQILLPVSGQLPKDLDLFRFVDYLDKQRQLDYAGEQFLAVHVKALLYQLSAFMQNKQMGYDRGSLADEIFFFLSEHYGDQLGAERLEKHFHLTYRQLNGVFYRRFQTTIRQKLIDIRIQHAFNLLVNGESVAAVAAKTGFSDYFYFLKSFKRKIGITPKMLQQKYFRNP
ncbi:helix-turn-helix domain-containing protein [Cohnella caldifontis]|uniref:helix-turn-helix domain-containing protein n=1 Tax=Cohnella caldifontis TaxID=3027471 RepID=UPI0023EBB024|nr:AraC family transcriptional regulator [Cohnella sp. YIM B05605]